MGEAQQPVVVVPSASKSPSLLNHLVSLDAKLSLHFYNAFQFCPRYLLKALEVSGDGRLWFPIPVALSLSSKSPYLRFVLLFIFLGCLFDLLLVGSIKVLVRRPRPVYNKGMHLVFAADHWSFPSGHSSRVFLIANCLYLSSDPLVEAVKEFKYSGWDVPDGEVVWYSFLVVFIWSILTSASRILLGRHYVFDVVAGSCLGVVEALLVSYFLNAFPIYSV
ncbi:probable lipid phosphate phosphatase beta [Aristolochia californica]|uniref:probable lipid phosphate phosphatase beta n=1 Tax=Aristolochia californica TaxID=171875 RepID=UPI0035D77986